MQHPSQVPIPLGWAAQALGALDADAAQAACQTSKMPGKPLASIKPDHCAGGMGCAACRPPPISNPGCLSDLPLALHPPCPQIRRLHGLWHCREQPAEHCEPAASCEHSNADPKLPLVHALPLQQTSARHAACHHAAPPSHAPFGQHVRRALRLADIVDHRAVVVRIALCAGHQSRHRH